MLVSNRTVPYQQDTAKNLKRFYTRGAVGHIWWEHNAHKVASIFGYGEGADTNATQGTKYKVGSGIDDAPDMTEGDKGEWKIGEEPQDKINISAARSLTLTEVEEKLGITKEKINDPANGFRKRMYLDAPYYGDQATTSMTYVVQRNIGSSNQDWSGGDKLKGKAKNKGYKMTNRDYSWGGYNWEENPIPETKYKDMLFNGINGWTGLATNALGLSSGWSKVGFLRGNVDIRYMGR